MTLDPDSGVTSLWRLLHHLDEDELEWSQQGSQSKATAGKHRLQYQADGVSVKKLSDEDSLGEESTDEEEFFNRRNSESGDSDLELWDGIGRQPRARGRRHQEVAMKTGTSKTVGERGRRHPSPKRTPAPVPPSPRDCPSPLPKMVSTADISPADHEGWLIDQLRGRRVWCAISDMLFCVFEKDDSRVSKQVILLPGCRVRQIEFKSASQEGRVLNGVARHFASKTISGVDKFQFVIENSISRQKHMFGVMNKAELEGWMQVLVRACSLDVYAGDDLEQVTTDQVDESELQRERNGVSRILNPPVSEMDKSRKVSSGKSPSKTSASNATLTPPAYSPAQTLPSRLDVHSLSLSVTQPLDVTKDVSVDDIRKRIRKESQDADTKPIPMKASHQNVDGHADTETCKGPGSSSSGGNSSSNGNNNKVDSPQHDDKRRRARSFFKMKSPLDVLLRRKKRSSSADDAQKRRKLFPMMDTDTMSNPSFSPRLSDSQGSIVSSLSSNQSLPSPDSNSISSSLDSRDSSSNTATNNATTNSSISNSSSKTTKKRGGFLSRSLDAHKNSKGLTSSIRRTASDLKDKMFSSSSPSSTSSPRSKSAGLKLKDLADARVSGFLQYRLAYKWIKVWAALCRGCFYAFKGDKPEESPILAVVLNQCCVTYVAEPEKRHKQLFAFKLSQSHCKSIYICAEDHTSLVTWILALQTEAAKIQVDEDLMTEVREKRSSQKKRAEREAKAGLLSDEDSEHVSRERKKELKTKRNSCPDFSGLDSKYTTKTLTGNDKSPEADSTTSTGSYREHKAGKRAFFRTKSERCFEAPHDLKPASQEIQLKYSGVRRLHETSASSHENGHDVTKQTPTAAGGARFQQVPADVDEVKPEYPPPTHGDAVHEVRNLSGVQAEKDFDTLMRKIHANANSRSNDVTSTHRSSALFSTSPVAPPTQHVNEVPSPRAYQDKDDRRRKSKQTEQETGSHNVSGQTVPDDNCSKGHYTPSDHRIRSLADSLGHVTHTTANQNTEAPYELPSPRYDGAVLEAWSKNEDFLVNVIKDKLRRRRQREPMEGGHGSLSEGRGGVNGEVCMVDGWGSPPPPPPPPPPDREAPEAPAVTPEKTPSVLGHDNPRAMDQVVPVDAGASAETPQPPEKQELMEGFVDRRLDKHWSRTWCVLKDACLCYHRQSDDPVPYDIMELNGYHVTQLVDQYQGKRFVLCLEHKRYSTEQLSVDSREELLAWYDVIRTVLGTSEETQHRIENQGQDTVSQAPEMLNQSKSTIHRRWANTSQSKPAINPEVDSSNSASVPGVQSVKQKLLTEMLRQRLELEKMQAMRNGLKGGYEVKDLSASTPSLTSSLVTEDISHDDRICALTRLRQRRMSTQIKLHAIQKQIATSTNQMKEKKTVFQRGRKRPDLVQGDADSASGQQHQQHSDLDLEEQVKLLSTRLQELDTHISSHGAVSPRELGNATRTQHPLRHSSEHAPSRDIHLPNGFKFSRQHPATDGSSPRSEKGRVLGSSSIVLAASSSPSSSPAPKEKDKDKDVNKSGGLKSSVQKLAHRTFAKASWVRHKKSSGSADSSENKHKASPTSSSTSSNVSTMNPPPDVIDMTNNKSYNNNNNNNNDDDDDDDIRKFLTSSLDTSDIRAPPDSFRTDAKTPLSSTLPSSNRARPVSLHRTPKERILARMSSSHSFTHPDVDTSSALTASSSSPSLVKSQPSAWAEEWRQLESSIRVSSHSGDGDVTRGADRGRREGAGSYSAPNSARGVAKGHDLSTSLSPRREVKPSALAEIEAFEELSSKFIGPSAISPR